MSVLRVSNLNFTIQDGFFAKKKAILRDVSFQIDSGQVVGFIGNNGAGKTTTIKSILEFIKPDSGEVLFFDYPLAKSSKARMGYLPERPYLYEFLTAKSFLRTHWDLSGKIGEFDNICSKTLDRVGLQGVQEKRLRNFSKGMMQRIGLAQAIMTEPDFIILDEPMSGLDPDGRMLVKEILREEKQRGATIFFSSHLLSDMQELCSHLVVMQSGQVVYTGTVQDFSKNSESLEKAFSDWNIKSRGLQ